MVSPVVLTDERMKGLAGLARALLHNQQELKRFKQHGGPEPVFKTWENGDAHRDTAILRGERAAD